MTTTTTDQFKFVRVGDSYAGSALWNVYTAGGTYLGTIAKSNGKRGATWMARTPDVEGRRVQSFRGLRNRVTAARRLLEATS